MTEMLVSFRIVDWHASWEELEAALDAFAATNGVEIDCIGVGVNLNISKPEFQSETDSAQVPLDPKPWGCHFGCRAADESVHFRHFSPRESFEQDRARYEGRF